jgi:hypothetical protein
MQKNDWSIVLSPGLAGAQQAAPLHDLAERETCASGSECLLLLGGVGEFAGGFDDLLGEVVADAGFVAGDRQISGA